MRIQSKPLLIIAAVIAAAAVILFTIHSYRHRFVREDRDILGLLPGGDVTTFFADLSALRSAGMLDLLAGSTPAGDAEYKRFVRETQFDYTKDLDAVAGAATSEQTLLVARGHFDWEKLRQYATAHGGNCRKDVCRLPSSTPGRWTSFLPIQPDVLAIGLSADETAAEQVRPDHPLASEPIPSTQPIWMKMAHSVLQKPLSLPAALRIFAVSLQSADPVILSIGRAPEHTQAIFEVQLDAQCANAGMAEATRNQLEIQTKMLNLELTREHVQPNAADLTGLLTAGAFQVVGNRVVGSWPVRKELLRTLQ